MEDRRLPQSCEAENSQIYEVESSCALTFHSVLMAYSSVWLKKCLGHVDVLYPAVSITMSFGCYTFSSFGLQFFETS